MCCISGQFLELNMILGTSSSSSSGPVSGDDNAAASSDSSASSDFTLPTPAITPPSFSSFNPDALRMIVQDISAAEIPGQSSFFFFFPY